MSVRERSMRSIERNLKDIRRANGYNTDVNHVYRLRLIPDRVDDPPVIILIFGNTPGFESTNMHIIERAQMEVWIVQRFSDCPDTDYNLFVADVQRALRCSNVFDTFGSHSHEVYCRFEAHRPFYESIRESQNVGRLTYEVEYRYLIEDPRKWDSADELVPLAE